ncbi:hypothetical protein [Reyranella sp.]
MKSVATPQHKAAMGRPYGLTHVTIGPAETRLQVQMPAPCMIDEKWRRKS